MRRFLSCALLLAASSLLLLLLGAHRPTERVLAWETTARGFTAWELEQCEQRGQGCRPQGMIAALSPNTRTFTVQGLPHNRRHCWRIWPRATGQTYAASNDVCD